MTKKGSLTAFNVTVERTLEDYDVLRRELNPKSANRLMQQVDAWRQVVKFDDATDWSFTAGPPYICSTISIFIPGEEWQKMQIWPFVKHMGKLQLNQHIFLVLPSSQTMIKHLSSDWTCVFRRNKQLFPIIPVKSKLLVESCCYADVENLRPE